MIRYQFDVENYWKVIVFFNMDYNFFSMVSRELLDARFSIQTIKAMYESMYSHKAKAVTCSNPDRHISIVIFNEHKRVDDYINSIVHEAEHIKQAMLRVYNIKDAGENPAYTIGYLVMMMYRGFREFMY